MNVVSFFAPRPEHPFYQDYTPFLDLLRASCERHKQRHIVLTDDPVVGDDAYVVDLPRSLMKATIAAQLAYLSDPQFAGVPTLLTGADCVLARSPLIFACQLGAPDIVITTDDRFTDCRMNCGAIFIADPARLAPVWAAALAGMGDEWGDDQTAVYGAICTAQKDGLNVLELPCDPYNLAPVHPGDDCSLGVVLHFRGPRKAWMVDYCHLWLGLGDGMKIITAPNTESEVMAENVRANLLRGLPQIVAAAPNGEDAILVGSGPSAADFLDQMKDCHARGLMIFALNGAARWLIEHDIVPDFGVILDPRASNAAFIVDVRPRFGWLLASQCDAAVIEAADDVTLFHFADPAFRDVLPAGAMTVGGGATVGLTAMAIAYALGYRRLHLIGYDSSEHDGATHLISQPRTSAEAKKIQAWHGNQYYTTSPGMLEQARAFEKWANTLIEAGAEIIVHGTGLLPSIAHSMLLQPQQAAAAD